MRNKIFAIWIFVVATLLTGQQIVWTFDDGTTTDLTISNGAVYTGTGSGSTGQNFNGTALMFNGSATRSVTMPPVNSADGTGTLSFKLIYGNSSNGGENIDNGENVALYYSTDGGTNFIKHTDFTPLTTYRQSTYVTVSVNLTGSLAASSIIYMLQQESHSGPIYDHWALDDLDLNVADITAPTITGTTVASDNSTISVTFSEAVFNTTSGSGDLEASDFTLSISGGTATLASAIPSSISISGNVYTLGLSLTGTPDGGETLTVNPADDSIYDGSANEASGSQSNNTVTLNDQAPPIITAVSLALDNSTLTVTFSEAVYTTTGANTALVIEDFSFSISGGTATLSSATPSSISISGNVFTLGISLSGTPDGNETLTVNPVASSIYDAVDNEASTTQSNNTVTLNDQMRPTILSTSLALDNSYIDITVSESVYNTNVGSGGLGVSDFSMTFTQNSGNATASTISSTKKNDYTAEGSATALAGGETVIRLFLNNTGIPSGVETITISPMDGFSIFDATGNAMDVAQSVGPITFNDQLAPTISSANLASNNSYIDVTISEAVYNTSGGSGALETTDFSLTFTQNSGNATAVSITSIKKNDNAVEGSATVLVGGETVIRIFLNVTGSPSGVETIAISPVNASSIFDAVGNTMASSQSTGEILLKDESLPHITSVSLASNNITLAVTFSESVFNTNGGSGNLETSDFALTINGGTASLSSGTPSSISISGNVYTLGISLSGTADGTEVLTVNPIDDSIYDATANEASTTQTNNTATLNDLTLPTIVSVSLNETNSELSVTFSEFVYNTNSGSGSLEASDFRFSMSGGIAVLSSTTPSNISTTDNKTFVLGVALSGTVQGSEVLMVNPVDDSIYDSSANEASTNQSNNSVSLNDETFPTILSVTLAGDNSTLTVNMSEAVYNTNGGSGALEASDFKFSISGGTATLSSSTPSSISVAGNVYTLGLSLSGNPDGLEKLVINPVDDSIYDVAGNEMSTSQENNWAYLNDKVVPIISSVTLASDNSSLAVVMSEAVYNATGGSGNLEANDFSFSLTGGTATLTNATPSSISISSNTYTLGIGLTGTPDGNEILVVNPVDDSIYDADDNEASTAQENNSVSLNDNTLPTITSVSATNSDGTYGIGKVVAVTVTFSEVVNVVGTPQLTLETGTTDAEVSYSSGSGSSIITFNYTVAIGDSSSDLDYIGTTALALNNGTILDDASNAAKLTLPVPGALYSLGANKAIVIDGNAPTVSAVSSTKSDGTYSVNDTIPITVTFSEAVTVTGTPKITMETGDTDAIVDYLSGSGTTIITFNYIVAIGHVSSDLDYTSTTALVLNEGTIKDASENGASLTLPTPGASNSLGANKALVIDSSGPNVTSVSSTTADGAYNSGDTINVTVSFNESVIVSGTPQISLETGLKDGVANYVSGSGSTVLLFDYIVDVKHMSMDLAYEDSTALILNAGIINDGVGNAAQLTLPFPGKANSLSANKAIVIDNVAPSILKVAEGSTTPNNDADYQGIASSLDVSWSASDSISGISKFEYGLGTSPGGVETITWIEMTELTDSSVSLTNLTLSDGITYYAVVRATDKAGNMSVESAGDGIMIDLTIPVSGSIRDGLRKDLNYTAKANILSGNWSGFSDSASGIVDYQFAIGTTSGGSDIKNWSSNGIDTTVTVSGFTLNNGQSYYFSVNAIDRVGLSSDTVTTDGIIADHKGPKTGTVIDGLTSDDSLSVTDSIYASWSGFADELSGIQFYEYAVGSNSGGSDLIPWTNHRSNRSIALKHTLKNNLTYFVSVRAIDNVGNKSNIATSSGVTTDFSPPEVIATSIENNTVIPLNGDTRLIYTISEPITAATLSIISNIGATIVDTMMISDDLTLGLSNVTVTLKGPLSGHDIIILTIDGLTDRAGNVSNDIEYTYRTALLGDYDMNGKIDVSDMAKFAWAWNIDEFEYELGPTQGSVPNLRPMQDGKFDARDMMAFTRMWHWNQNNVQSALSQTIDIVGEALNLTIENDHLIIQPPTGSRALELNINFPVADIQLSLGSEARGEEGIGLSNVDTLNGRLIFQAGYFSDHDQPIIINTNYLGKDDLTLDIAYQFIGKGFDIISSGQSSMELKPVPKSFSLSQNFPNPFNPVTTINFDLPKDAHVRLVVYDLLGREVIELINNQLPASYHSVTWNSRNREGHPLAAGIYFYQIQTAEFNKTKKMVLLQ